MVKSSRKKSVRAKPDPGETSKINSSSTSKANFRGDSDESGAFKKAFDEVEDYAIILLDSQGIVLSWNKGAEKIKGYREGEIIGRNYRMFYTSEEKQEGVAEMHLEQARTEGKCGFEGWRVRSDGVRFWGSVTLSALHASDGQVDGFLNVTRDLTDKKIAEDNYSNFVEELRLKNEELRKSEERYHKMIAEVMDYAIILLDQEGKVLDWNKGAEALKGYTASEILGKSFRLFYSKDEKDAGLPDRLLAEAARRGSVTHDGWRLRKDGTRFWGNVTLTALHDSQGSIIGFSKVTRDFTQRKIAEDQVSIILDELRQANEQLKQSEERYHRMIAEVQDYAIILLDKVGDIVNWNNGAELIKGYKPPEIIGKNFRIFYTEEDRNNKLPEELLKRAVDEGKATHEGWRVRKDGTRFWGSIVITALHDTNGEVIGFSKVTRDLTERKKAEDLLRTNAAQLDLKNKSLERLNEELSSFARVASHDMKEPLRKIQTFAARMEDIRFDPEKSNEFVSKIKSTAAGMQELIEDLLAYSQVSADPKTQIFEKIDLNKILKTVLTDLEIPIQEKGALIEADKLPVLRGVSYQIRQMFLNLISNAIKFTKPGEKPRIIIRHEVIKGPDLPGQVLDGGNKYHHITLSDNGVGFPQQHSDRIFEVFQRLHPRRVFAGTGVGLAIVKKVVENHNGIVSAEGIPGVGATFHMYLPAR